MRSSVVRSALLLLLGATALAGCGDPLSLLPAVFENRVDTLDLYAATRTPVTLPSGFVISQRNVVRLDQSPAFDFLYDLTPSGEPAFMPLAAVVNTGRTTGNPGFRASEVPFDLITIAEQQNYITSDTVRIRVGDVYFVRSTIDGSCGLGIPYYGKLQVLALSDEGRQVTFQILTNINCGYRGLETGLPTK